MTQETTLGSGYALGHSDAEHERLICQAMVLAPVTERLLREVGIRAGQRVLDVGSGVGDVSMIAARLVGPSGEVVGVERDGRSIARAMARISAAGFDHVSFVQADVNDVASDQPFDAVVGRAILMYQRDPLSVLRTLMRLIVPGGVVAFQEPSWMPMLALGASLPLWSRTLGLIHEIFLRSGVNPEMGLDLFRLFEEAGLLAPRMHFEMALGSDARFAYLKAGLLRALTPLADQCGLQLAELGEPDTLSDRLHAEMTFANTVVCHIATVSAWSTTRRPSLSSPS